MRRLLGIFLTLLVIIYVVGALNTPLIFIIVFFIIFWITAITILTLFITNLILKLPFQRIKSIYEVNRTRFKAAIAAYITFFLLSGLAINHYLLPHIFHPISFLGNAGFLFFMIFLGWSLLYPVKKKNLLMTISVFSLFIFLLVLVVARNSQYIGPSSVERLDSFPYLTWVSAENNIQKSGVTVYDPKKSFSGINIYNSCNSSTAYLINMSGKILHAWSAKMHEVGPWQHIEMDRNGNLLYFVDDTLLIKLDWDSRLQWFKKIYPHHDLDIDENGDIYALSANDEIIFSHGIPIPIRNEYITVLSKDGEIKEEISLFKTLKEEVSFSKIGRIYFWIIDFRNLSALINRKIHTGFFYFPDIFHSNTLEIINRDLKELCKKGDILLCFRALDLICILDIKNKKLIWSWGVGDLDNPHHPALLDNGNILIFDNGTTRGYSRIIELDPFTQKILWEYKAKPPEKFYSYSRGASQRLPNGNTLITNSYQGQVFEIDKDGKIVWEFYNPELDTVIKKRAAIYRMMRITDPGNYTRLRDLK